MEGLGAHASISQKFVILAREEAAAEPAFAVNASKCTVTEGANELATASAAIANPSLRCNRQVQLFSPPLAQHCNCKSFRINFAELPFAAVMHGQVCRLPLIGPIVRLRKAISAQRKFSTIMIVLAT